MAKNGVIVNNDESTFPRINIFFNLWEYNHKIILYIKKKITALIEINSERIIHNKFKEKYKFSLVLFLIDLSILDRIGLLIISFS